ncbi:hypothetical protein TNCV_1314991 [Trichonephila clavipes]|uniref:Uncharacterized protein n=1 Tax=Trichonephila clavipes TaxID=2585209 RepID=A0A8X6SN99_TRICX|nr:hypothetical protein TNCV_1314991 [Trichonephila clavipes]
MKSHKKDRTETGSTVHGMECKPQIASKNRFMKRNRNGEYGYVDRGFEDFISISRNEQDSSLRAMRIYCRKSNPLNTGFSSNIHKINLRRSSHLQQHSDTTIGV